MTVVLLNLQRGRERFTGLFLAAGQHDEPDSFNMLFNWKMSSFLYPCTHVSTLAVPPVAAFPPTVPFPFLALNWLSIPRAC